MLHVITILNSCRELLSSDVTCYHILLLLNLVDRFMKSSDSSFLRFSVTFEISDNLIKDHVQRATLCLYRNFVKPENNTVLMESFMWVNVYLVTHHPHSVHRSWRILAGKRRIKLVHSSHWECFDVSSVFLKNASYLQHHFAKFEFEFSFENEADSSENIPLISIVTSQFLSSDEDYFIYGHLLPILKVRAKPSNSFTTFTAMTHQTGITAISTLPDETTFKPKTETSRCQLYEVNVTIDQVKAVFDPAALWVLNSDEQTGGFLFRYCSGICQDAFHDQRRFVEKLKLDVTMTKEPCCVPTSLAPLIYVRHSESGEGNKTVEMKYVIPERVEIQHVISEGCRCL